MSQTIASEPGPHPRRRLRGASPALLDQARHPEQAEVSDHHLVGVVEHVLGLQVLVDDAFGVQVTHPLKVTHVQNNHTG